MMFLRAAGRIARRSAIFGVFRRASRSKTLLLALVLGIAGQSLGQALQADEQPSTVHGTVVNSVTHAPIARALVFSADNPFAMLTDGSGHFEFALPKTSKQTETSSGQTVYFSTGQHSFQFRGDRIWLRARKPGFLDATPGRPQVADPAEGEVTISLVPEALIKGRITLSTGDAASGIAVQLYSRQVVDGLPRWMPGVAAAANSAGEFRFAELQAGAYKVVTHEFMDNDPTTRLPGAPLYGFPPVYYPGAPDLAAAATIKLTAGQTFEANMALIAQPYYGVKIPVTNGNAFNGVTVSIEGQRRPGYSLGYNGAEQRIEGLLPNGNYIVEAAVYGMTSAMGKVNLRVTGGPVEGPPVTLVPNSSITFDVKEEFNEAPSNQFGPQSDRRHTPSGPRVSLQPSLDNADDFEQLRGGSIRPPTGPDDDSLVMENLFPGRYWLRLSTPHGYVASATLGTTDLLHDSVVIGSGSNTHVEVILRDDGAEIEGTVTTIAAQAATAPGDISLPGAWVCFIPLPNSSGQFQQTGVSGDGKFTSPMLAPGSYRVLAFASLQENLPYRDPEAMKAYETKGPVINLTAGQKATVQVPIINASE